MNDMSPKPAAEFNEDEDPFLANPRLLFMKRLVIAMGIALIIGLLTVLMAIAYRVAVGVKTGSQPPALTKSTTTSPLDALTALKQNGTVAAGQLPAGSQHRSTVIDGKTAILTFEDEAGFSILTVDTTTGKITAVTRLSR